MTSASSLLSVFGSGCRYYANVKWQNDITLNRWRNEDTKLWVFRKMAKWRRWPLMLHGWWQRQLIQTHAFVFRRDCSNDMLWRQKHRWRWSCNCKDRSKFRKYHAVLQNFRLRYHKWFFTADGNGGCYELVPSFSEEIAWTIRCRRQNITGDDQAILRVDQNSANIALT